MHLLGIWMWWLEGVITWMKEKIEAMMWRISLF